MNKIKLTQYSHGAGCGCKISPKQLSSILKSDLAISPNPNLLIGNESNDDAAAYDLGDGTSVLSTTDFFMPIVDDPFTFGKIAATNSISDIYAMGGEPLMAISIFGWPVSKLSDEVAREVIEGGRYICQEAGIPLAGGHSIDAPEPIFGLAVTGRVKNSDLKYNNKAKEGSHLFLTKPIGIGILTTAQKQGKISDTDLKPAIEAMTTLNKVGAVVSKLKELNSMTDVTGFGLLGHLIEMCEGSGVSAKIDFEKVPLLPKTKEFQELGCVPGGSKRNYESYGHKVRGLNPQSQDILCDAQTSGGLLCAVEQSGVEKFLQIAKEFGLDLEPIGTIIKKDQFVVEVV